MIKHKAGPKNITILAIGDYSDYDSFCKLNKEKRYMRKKGFDYRAVSYDRIIKKQDILIETDNVIILPFFPFKYWNKHIENKKYKGLYGNMTFRNKFLKFCGRVEKNVRGLVKGKKYFFINDLKKCAYYRDKRTVMNKLKKSRVNIPENYGTKSVTKVLSMIQNGEKLFIKPRCGSMGKGITYLEEGNWQTNFTFRGNKIKNRYSDKGWKFKKVTGKTSFLKNLIPRGFFIEKAVDTAFLGRDKVDFRVYVLADKVLYIYPRKNSSEKVTTNISQGGKGRPALLKKVHRKTQSMIKKEALKASKSLGPGFYGIDVVVDKDKNKAYVIDVNMFPGFPKRRTFNLARKMADNISGFSPS